MPDHVTADRLDRVTVGQFVNLDSFTLTDPAPDDGWVEVAAITTGETQIMLSLLDETTFSAPADRLVLIGWNN